MNELKPYELRDPAALIKGIADVVTLVEDTAWLALVHHPSTEQRLVRVDPLPVPALLDDDDEISPHLRAAAEAFDLGWPVKGQGPEHMAVTVVVRKSLDPAPPARTWLDFHPAATISSVTFDDRPSTGVALRTRTEKLVSTIGVTVGSGVELGDASGVRSMRPDATSVPKTPAATSTSVAAAAHRNTRPPRMRGFSARWAPTQAQPDSRCPLLYAPSARMPQLRDSKNCNC